MTAYKRPPSSIFERMTIAILCSETLDLHWQDEKSQLSYLSRVFPYEIVAENGADYLAVRDNEGTEHRIRMDLIFNIPRPVK